MIVFEHVIWVIIVLHIPETLEGRVYTLLEALDYVHLRHQFASSKHNHISSHTEVKIRWKIEAYFDIDTRRDNA